MPTLTCVEHIWSAIQTLKSVEWIVDQGDEQFQQFVKDKEYDCNQTVFDWMGELADDVGLPIVFVDTDNATCRHMRFAALLPTADMTPEEIAEEPSIISEENGCQRIYIDVYPLFGGCEIVIRDNDKEEGDGLETDDMVDLADRFIEALHTVIEVEKINEDEAEYDG